MNKLFYFSASTVFILDRLAKLLVIVNIPAGGRRILAPYLNIVHIYNTGAAFSLFTGRNTILMFINALIIAALIIAIKLTGEKNKTVLFSYALITGGALSNLADRALYRGVVDYIDFKVWPVFNLADVAITAGAALILLDLLKNRCKKKEIKKNVP